MKLARGEEYLFSRDSCQSHLSVVSFNRIGLPPPRQIRFSLRFLKPSKSLDPSSRSHRQSNKNGKDEEN